jgi:hypothetical protein
LRAIAAGDRDGDVGGVAQDETKEGFAMAVAEVGVGAVGAVDAAARGGRVCLDRCVFARAFYICFCTCVS